MGWLREQMGELEPWARSFGDLAKRIRRSRAWPRNSCLSESSLATYLGKLDKGDSEWLLEHPGVMPALAEVLGMAPEDLREQLQGPEVPARKGERRVSLAEPWDSPHRPEGGREPRSA